MGLKPTECVALTCGTQDRGVGIKHLNSVFRASAGFLETDFQNHCLALTSPLAGKKEWNLVCKVHLSIESSHTSKASVRLLCVSFLRTRKRSCGIVAFHSFVSGFTLKGSSGRRESSAAHTATLWDAEHPGFSPPLSVHTRLLICLFHSGSRAGGLHWGFMDGVRTP